MTTKEWQIIKEFAEHHRLKPALSIPAIGKFMFIDQEGVEITTHMTTMKKEVEELRKGDHRS